MKLVPLTQGYFAKVDDADYDAVMAAGKWIVQVLPHGLYAARREHGTRRYLYLHRFVLGITDPKVQVDHRNRSGLDCQRHNLRVCTQTLNNGNRKKQKNTRSEFKGVYLDKRRGSWQARVKINGKHRYLGAFKNESQAGLAYDAAAIELFGDFALTNQMLGLLPAKKPAQSVEMKEKAA